MDVNGKEHAYSYAIVEDIHNYAKKIAWTKRRLATLPQGDIGIRFIDKLKLVGLSDARLCYYGDRVPRLLDEFEKIGVKLKSSKKKDCEAVLSVILSQKYKGETKCAFAVTLLRLVHFAKKDEIGDKKRGYVKEVAWISPTQYKDKNQGIQPKDLLTIEELKAIINQTTNKRDRAMLWVMFEGAFRPGELLHLRVGGIDFRDDYVLVSTHGKTGSKSVALVISFKPLLEWLDEHPLRDDPNAPLWYSFWKSSRTKQVTYGYLREHLKRCKEKAGIKKRVWNYLFRHSQLTNLAKKLSDQTLRVYGNWGAGSKMPAKYAHLSGKDAENAILELHGIRSADNNNSAFPRLKKCPRCGSDNTPEKHRCTSCGYIIDERLLAETLKTQQSTIEGIVKRLENVEKLGEKIDLLFDELINQKSTCQKTEIS
ncbi:tyrosine-type recombinase/integrase [Candidatus Nitrosotenuis uzonensis]|uniref:Putative integrase family protein n=1 Tax=Candidatus Nitrosotenuis uzonensis TaxID=1407055 RepID=A0A812F2J6_9ARCH|nr:tyrosine-type recombinase/integrase [Candidatus Nitrosotenuis uzonensis]CAE6501104.1 putative integrase family protein [Candidatus Nitrosotenuis uzonensis]